MWSAFKFANQLRKHWGGIVTSGALIGGLGIWQSTGHSVKPNLYWAIAIVGLIFAAYRAWDDQYQRFNNRDREAREKEANLQTQLDALKRWSFEVEFLKASRAVYMYGNGSSPFLAVYITVRIHNRNRESTTVYSRGISVELPSAVDQNFQAATITPGGAFHFESPEEYSRYDVAGSTSIDLLFYARRYDPPVIEEYTQDRPLTVTLDLGETFSEGRTISGPMSLAAIERQ